MGRSLVSAQEGLYGSEADREREARRFACPHCEAEPDTPCRSWPRSINQHGTMFQPAMYVSHYVRYKLAVEAGTVPALPGAS